MEGTKQEYTLHYPKGNRLVYPDQFTITSAFHSPDIIIPIYADTAEQMERSESIAFQCLAAPDLLEALERIVNHYDNISFPKLPDHMRDNALAAIAKATSKK